MTRITKIRYINSLGKEIAHELDPRDTQKFLKCMNEAALGGDLGSLFVRTENLTEKEAEEWIEWSKLI